MDERLKELLEKELLTIEESEEIEEMQDVKECNIVSGMCDKYSDAVWMECVLQDGNNYDFYVEREKE